MKPQAALAVELATEADTEALARHLASGVRAGGLLVLSGPLGSGKTFLTRCLCRALGLSEDIRVPSPTFTLMHEYPTTPPVAHADVYRLSSEEELVELGLDAQRDEGFLVVVEWGEPYIDCLGGDALLVRLSFDPRRAELTSTGPSSSEMLEAVRDSRGRDRGSSGPW